MLLIFVIMMNMKYCITKHNLISIYTDFSEGPANIITPQLPVTHLMHLGW